MDRENHKPLKITLKLKGEKILEIYSNKEEETGAAGTSALPGSPTTNAQNQDRESDGSASETDSEATEDDLRTLAIKRQQRFSNKMPRGIGSVGSFAVQCDICSKWRLIPTKERYEEIREQIMDRPFICEVAREWKNEMSCEYPADLIQDGSRLWAMDKPSVPQTPPGWQRLLKIRAEGGTKFADVYYISPTGKQLRSMVEVERYLSENLEYIAAGIDRTKFSFQVPRPLQRDYVRKRPPPSPLPFAPILNMNLSRASSSMGGEYDSSSGLVAEAEPSKKE
ncbi:methyl-CpG-binding domain-containing protein 2-like [Andrographis paniculata]|uniref:methyl-CpG-binding domain-containing protein 2-like n=1 Tax=Andrographis paniculata TaxID=175694 RepID=UPI0021E9AC81|nr:methyl-CpG-binding domain-containing protein 2-like [Andrographis paniculata]